MYQKLWRSDVKNSKFLRIVGVALAGGLSILAGCSTALLPAPAAVAKAPQMEYIIGPGRYAKYPSLA